MKKLEPIAIRFSAEERTALKNAAKADDRTISGLARKLAVDALKKAGWLK